MSFKLSVPAPEQNLTVETQPRQVAEWLAALPLTNPNETARAVLDSLSATNRSKVATDIRLKLLELYRDAIARLLPSLELLYVGHPLPLPEKSRLIAGQVRQLQTELANGYKIVLQEHAGKRISFGNSKHLPLAAEHAIASLGQMLVVCYQTYAPTPAGVWAEMHALFMYAVEYGIQDEPVPERERRSSVNLAYKQALLLALLDPYRLMQGEVNKVLDYLSSFGSHAHLQPLVQTSNPSGFFLVRLDSDKPPRALAHEASVTDARTDILLNTIELARLLHQQIRSLESGVSPKSLGLHGSAQDFGFTNLLRRMLKHWGVTPKRMFSRLQTNERMDICAGIRPIHRFLSGETVSSAESLPDAQEEQGRQETEITLDLADSPLDNSSHHTYVSRNWLIANESAGGIALLKDPKADAQVRVGEIIGLRPEGSETWNIGVVRWVSSESPGHLQLGAQMLAPSALPVMVRAVIAGSLFQPALVLPEIPALKQPATLLTLSGSYQPQCEFMLEGMGRPQNIRATKLLEATSNFDLFEFAPLQA